MTPSVAGKSPALAAIERLAKMASNGASAAKMVTAAEGILISWTSEDLPADELRERIEQLQGDIDAGVQAAEDYVAEADNEKSRAAAHAQLEALAAVKARLAAMTN